MDEALHFDVAHVGRVYGGYIAGVYFLPLVGGLLADRAARLQPRDHHRRRADDARAPRARRRVAARSSTPGLVLLACGSGLLKPNVSTMVGNLYRDRPELRDQGFNIFYMGINIGALHLAAHGLVAARALRLERRRSCRRRSRWLLSLLVFVAVQPARRRRRPSRWTTRASPKRGDQPRRTRDRASSRCWSSS